MGLSDTEMQCGVTVTTCPEALSQYTDSVHYPPCGILYDCITTAYSFHIKAIGKQHIERCLGNSTLIILGFPGPMSLALLSAVT